MKFLYSLVVFAFGVTAIQAQDAGVSGRVLDPDGVPVAYAHIQIESLKRGTETDAQGRFQLENLPAGTHNLRISYVGFRPVSQDITLRPNQQLSLGDIFFAVSREQLREVVVTGNGNNGAYSRPKSDYVSKMSVRDIENPQVAHQVTGEVLKEQLETTLEGALRNAPGIAPLWQSTGRGGDGAGYFALRGFPTQPTLMNGLPALTNGSPDVANIANIEVIKGPSATLYGSPLISYGGLINVVTKRPYQNFGGTLGYQAGSFGLNRVTADVNAPLDAEGRAAVRINTAHQDQNSFQDAGFRRTWFVAPSFSYQVNDRLSFFVNTEFFNGQSTNPTMLFLDRAVPLRATNLDELNYDPERSYTSNDIVIENPTFSLQSEMRYRISDTWTSQTAFSRGSARTTGLYSYLYETTQFYQNREEVPGEVTNLEEGLVFTRYINSQNSETNTTDIQQNFTGSFQTGGIKHRVLLGLDWFNRKVTDNNSGYIANGNVYLGNASLQNVNESVFGIYDPSSYISDGDSGILSREATEGLLEGVNRNNLQTRENIYSAYAQDLVEFTEQFSLMAAVRLDHFSGPAYEQTTASPKVGVVFQPIVNTLSLFANYQDGFRNIGPRQQGDPSEGATTTVTFSPERARQWEGGAKWSLLDGHLTGSVSYYDIRVSNTVIEDANQPFFFVQDGEQFSRGVELSLAGTPLNGLYILGGFSFNDSEITQTDQANFLGRRPESAGPETLVNLWATYRFQNEGLKGLGLGFGGNYASENAVFNRSLGTFTLPSFTTLNASVFYEVPRFTFTLKWNNLNDAEIYQGWTTVNPQPPMNVTGGIQFHF